MATTAAQHTNRVATGGNTNAMPRASQAPTTSRVGASTRVMSLQRRQDDAAARQAAVGLAKL
jgi:hypothetical protein